MNYSLEELQEIFKKRECTLEILNAAVCDIREAMEDIQAPTELSTRFHLTANLALIITNRDYFSELVDIGNRIVQMNVSDKSNMEAYFGLHILYTCIGFTPKVVEYGLKVIDSPEKNKDLLLSVYTSLAIICKETGLTDKAIEYTEMGCGMDAGSEEQYSLKVRLVSTNNIAMIYLDNGRIGDAIRSRNELVKLMEEHPDDPEVAPLYPMIWFSVLLVDAHSTNKESAIEQYVTIMGNLMAGTKKQTVARQTLQPHITFLNRLLDVGRVDDVLRIAEYIRENPSNFFGNRTMLYKVMINAYNLKSIAGEPYNELLMSYIDELEHYREEQEAVISLLVVEQYRIREVDNRYDVIRKKFEDDSLTHCLNRQSFNLNGQEYVEQNAEGSLIFADLDNLKKTNDRFGHSAGDRLLIEFVRCVNRVKPDTVLFYRYAGDEFILLTPLGINETETFVTRIAEECNKVSGRAGEELRLEFSYGIAAFCEGAKAIGDVVDLADKRMYECKKRHQMMKGLS